MALADNVGIPANLGIFTLTDTTGATRALRCKAQEIGKDLTANTQEEETYCGVATVKGSTKIQYSGRFLWDGDDDAVDEVLYGLQLEQGVNRAYEWGPGGSATGRPKYTGSGFLVSHKIAARTPGSILVDIVYNSVSEARGAY